MDQAVTDQNQSQSTGTPRRRRFTRIPVRYVLPNLVTLLGLCLGLTAIRFAFEERYEMAVYAIVAAAVVDGLDGRIARALKGTSRFGAELDSLADFIDFGVAPAILLYFWTLNEIKSYGWFAVLVYVVACALRLARFNVALDDPDKPQWKNDFFTGMPSPAGAITVMLPIYLHYSVIQIPHLHILVPFEIGFVLLVSFLMISSLPHYSGKKLGRVPRDKFVVVLFAVIVGILLLVTSTMEMLAILSIAYLGLIPWSYRRYRRLEKENAAPPARPEDVLGA
ncbi:MAG: CDP-diacylglycerol--serine O-phosphatidyltransferase [Hyphomicrobiales bacterium]|nr:CDP-diacylglycerol--serine O-phosphatidyltransferase [Hyphomicrobiales bacterium]